MFIWTSSFCLPTKLLQYSQWLSGTILACSSDLCQKYKSERLLDRVYSRTRFPETREKRAQGPRVLSDN